MIRTRRIWEDACLDIELSEVCSGAERLFWRMLSKTDDYGNLPASPKWLKGACVPLCDITVEEVETLRKELEEAELILTYEVDGELYANFRSFHRRQPFRRDYTKTRLYPGPDGERPDNLAVPRHERAARSALAHGKKATGNSQPPPPAQVRAGSAQRRTQKKTKKEKQKKKQNVKENGATSHASDVEESGEEEIGAASPQNGSAESDRDAPLSSDLGYHSHGAVNLLMAAYRTKQPDSVVSAEKLRHWIKADRARGIPAGEIEAAILNSRPGLYYHDIMNPVRRQFEARRQAEKRAPPRGPLGSLASAVAHPRRKEAHDEMDDVGIDGEIRKMIDEFRHKVRSRPQPRAEKETG